jgi:hypothetical protein
MQMMKSGSRIDPIVRIERVFLRKTFFRISGNSFTLPSILHRAARSARDQRIAR